MTLPERLKAVRASFAKSQREMALALGISTRTWQVYEEGGSIPGGGVLESLAGKGININWLLTGMGEMLATAGAFNKSRLILAVETVETALLETKRTMQPHKKGEMVAAVYELFGEEENTVEVQKNVLRLIKSAV